MRNEGIDLPTLLITAVASAAAAYTCSKIWAPGTLASAAFTPVLVAIIKEALSRPAQVVTKAVPVRGVVRSTPPPSQSGEPSQGPEPPVLDRVPQPGEVTYYHQAPGAGAGGGGGSAARGGGRRWRVAIVTGLLGFVIAVLVLTVPELVAGQAASGGGRSTTLFGGQDQARKQTTTAPTKTVTVKTRTVIVPAPTATTTVPTETTTTPTTTATTPTTTSTTPTVTQPPGVQP
ncbi:MAG: hypothetical protein QOD24_4661 [Solirubrobacteraceae bacterium]|jgi:hypothetical protein|nr:hypothetical protein [Solirubrobacteraceae bacterium]